MKEDDNERSCNNFKFCIFTNKDMPSNLGYKMYLKVSNQIL
jgi:hypothetical protein